MLLPCFSHLVSRYANKLGRLKVKLGQTIGKIVENVTCNIVTTMDDFGAAKHERRVRQRESLFSGTYCVSTPLFYCGATVHETRKT